MMMAVPAQMPSHSKMVTIFERQQNDVIHKTVENNLSNKNIFGNDQHMQLCTKECNEAQSQINKTLDGSSYPGLKMSRFSRQQFF